MPVTARPPQDRPGSEHDQFFLPDFCSIRMVFAVVIVAELLAFVLVLGSGDMAGRTWDELGIISLFIQWVCLSSAALLCAMRRWLCRLPNTVGGILSYLLVLLVTLLVSELAVWVGNALRLQFPGGWHLNFVLRNLGISAIVSAVVLRFFYLQYQQRRSLDARAQARIEALQARIRPHFLFNSMNTIAALIRTKPQHAEEAVEDLADLFRWSLADAGRMVTLAEELESAERYLHIEALRLGDRLKIHWDLDDVPKEALLPPLTLQPLLENAIYHGIERIADGGTVIVQGRSQGGVATLILRNPLPPEGSEKSRGGNQIALENIRERLRFAFGRRGQLTLEKHPDTCQVTLSFPVTESGS
jgi:two-component system sensor histidine kinase AlgZ